MRRWPFSSPPRGARLAVMAESDITRMLQRLHHGDAVYDELLELVYAELKRMARNRVSRESDMVTMGATGLVHEAWLRLTGSGWPDFENRRHFFSAAAEAMRRILIERARAAGRKKRGGRATRITLQEGQLAESADGGVDLMALDQALEELQSRDADMSQVVKLRYFCGLNIEEVADILQVSVRTVDRRWQAARAWMKVRLA